MIGYKARLERLESRWQRPKHHCVPVACYPWHLDEAAEARWVSAEVTCACGQRGCPALQIGVLLPEKAPRVDAEWVEGNGHDG